jgi:hypothetical protein
MGPALRYSWNGKIINKKKNIKNVNENTWLLTKKGQVYFYKIDYKTSRTYGKVLIDFKEFFDKDLLKILREYLKYCIDNNIQYFLENKFGNFMDGKGQSKYIPSLFKKVTGKPLGASIIRHMYLTGIIVDECIWNEYDMKTKQKLEKILGHSITMSLKYIKI